MSANPIGAITGAGAIRPPELPGESPVAGRKFADALAEAIGRVEQYRVDAHNSVESFLAGENEDLHHVALETQRADLAFEMFLQVRNKVVQAYQEVMRMQV